MTKEPHTSEAHNPLRVTFFGDSTCVGQGVSIYKGWVTRIAQNLDESINLGSSELLVTNSSVNGRTTRQALEDMPYHVQGSGVDILVIQFGLNDCNYWQTDNGLPRVSLAAFIANLQEIVSRGRQFGAKKIFLNNNHPTTRSTQPMKPSSLCFEQSNKAYNQAIRELAQSLPDFVEFQDIEARFQEIVGPDGDVGPYLLADGLHLSEKGHQVYFEIMAPILKRAVADVALR